MRSNVPFVRWIMASLAAVTLLARPSWSSAQTVATSFDELRTLVKPGDTVEVTREDGHKTTARVGALTETSLTLSVREVDRDGLVES